MNGILRANPSKSHMQRIIAASFLANGKTVIHNPDFSNDSTAALGLIEKLGASVNIGASIEINSSGFNIQDSNISCGESGLGIRMFSPIAALCSEKITLDGEGSLKQRPIGFVAEILNEIGVTANCKDGHVPLEIKGPLKGGKISLDASITSQFLSGLLLALPTTNEDSIVLVKNLKSKGYVDFTLDVLRNFGIKISNERYQIFRIPCNQKYKPCEIWVESDWSGASFMMVAAATAGMVKISGMDIQSPQPDQRILEVLENVGANITFSRGALVVEKNQLKSFEFDATNSPDLFPPLAALAASCSGRSIIKGTERLIHKESNRADSIVTTLNSLGIPAKVNNDKMFIDGGAIKGGEIDPFGDHRIAMMASILGINSDDKVTIKNSEVVGKSYPLFFEDIDLLLANN